MKTSLKITLLLLFLFSVAGASGQDFYFGNDLSYVNQMEDCGALFKENMVPKDVYRIFADHGCNLVRVRLWIDPSWWQDSLDQPPGVKSHYNDLEDVKETIGRAKAAGMRVMLGLHYSDFWADPGTQLIPRAWLDVAYDLEKLKDSVYNYTHRVLTELDAEGLMPDIVKVGNETNNGILKHIPEENGWNPVTTVSNDWSRHAQLFNAAISAIRAVGAGASINPRIAIHFAGLSGSRSRFNTIISNGVTDFDIMGLSYYYAWHGGSINQLEVTMADLVSSFAAYEVMIVETGYIWSTRNFDDLPNIVTDPDPQYLPVIPEKQLEYMVDYTRAVMRAGGMGVIFWEPAWVSTPCSTPWGVGSSHDHLVFFDPVNTNFMENGGGWWCDTSFYTNPENPKTNFKLDMNGQNVSSGVYIAGSWSGEPPEIKPMADEGGGIYSYFTYLTPGDTVRYYFLNDSAWTALEPVPQECGSGVEGAREFVVPPDNQDISFAWGTCEAGGPPAAVNVTFNVSMKGSGRDLTKGVFLVGEITDWDFIPMSYLGDSLYSVTLKDILPGTTTAYYYITNNSWTNYRSYRETVPEECAYSDEVTGDPTWTSDRGLVVPSQDTVVGYVWDSCLVLDRSAGIERGPEYGGASLAVYPNPASGELNLDWSAPSGIRFVEILDLSGRLLLQERFPSGRTLVSLYLGGIPSGIYILKVSGRKQTLTRRLLIVP